MIMTILGMLMGLIVVGIIIVAQLIMIEKKDMNVELVQMVSLVDNQKAN